MIITAHFKTLEQAVNEARKYGVSQKMTTIRWSIWQTGCFTFNITNTRTLTCSKQPDKRWKMAVDVVGHVVPALGYPRKHQSPTAQELLTTIDV